MARPTAKRYETNTMKVVYINGPYRLEAFSRSSRSPAVTKSGTIYYPLWLAYAVGLAKEQTGYQIELIDAIAKKMDHSALVKYLAVIKPDLVFCDTSTPSINDDIATATRIKSVVPNCSVVAVGTHATACTEEVLNVPNAFDAVARGEFEITAIELAKAIDNNYPWHSVAGLSFRHDNHIAHNPDRPLIHNLDILPFVSKTYAQYLKLEDYFFAAAQFPMIMIVTSRGCPHRCQWCLYPQVMHRGKYRMRSAKNVADEFAWIADNLPNVREIGIEDDLFTGDKKRLHEICELLIQQNNTINFWCDSRVDLDYQSMQLLKRAGCRLIIAGFESASQILLDRINKGTTVGQAFEFVKNARQAKLLVHGCFVLGNPGETKDDMQQTLGFAKKLAPDTAQFFPMIVYPGTKAYQWAKQNKYLRTADYDQWLTKQGLHNSVVDLPGLPGKTVVEFCDHARREFYLRKGYILRKVSQSMLSFHEARRNIKAFRRFAKYILQA